MTCPQQGCTHPPEAHLVTRADDFHRNNPPKENKP